MFRVLVHVGRTSERFIQEHLASQLLPILCILVDSALVVCAWKHILQGPTLRIESGSVFLRRRLEDVKLQFRISSPGSDNKD